MVDGYSRGRLAPIADTSLSGWRVIRDLEDLIATGGRPEMGGSGSRTELTSTAGLSWCQRTGAD